MLWVATVSGDAGRSLVPEDATDGPNAAAGWNFVEKVQRHAATGVSALDRTERNSIA